MKPKTKQKPRTVPKELREQFSKLGHKSWEARLERARQAAKEKETAK